MYVCVPRTTKLPETVRSLSIVCSEVAVFERTTVSSTSKLTSLFDTNVVIPSPPVKANVSPPGIESVPESPEMPKEVAMASEVILKIRPLAPYVMMGTDVVLPTVPATNPGTASKDALNVTLLVPLKDCTVAVMSPPEILKSLEVSN